MIVITDFLQMGEYRHHCPAQLEQESPGETVDILTCPTCLLRSWGLGHP